MAAGRWREGYSRLVREISHVLVAKQARQEEVQVAWLDQLLKGSRVYIPPKSIKTRSPELEQHLETIRHQLASNEYERMVANIQPVSSTQLFTPADRQQLKELKSQLSAIVNVTVSMGAVGFAVWVWMGNLASDVGMRFLASFAGALAIGAIETFLYWRYVSNAKERDPARAARRAIPTTRRRESKKDR
ncbi:hypothetical protein BZG36_03468 [Bifiguratus adelaidae]|uniref:Uncharacterized protein n=1 Tax=Bifiguratus adelaidae TaxID=1938954 RepID=A0A261XZG8_9FUNG|nr:hypothetical protein BZG36_03468 [Bifiguratus adelaidae]